MADERDYELLDDYLTNRMSEADRPAFEQKLAADPDLQNEYALQKRLIKGINKARAAELKSMLNNVPVPAAHGNVMASKMVLGTLLTLIIAGAAYWYFNDDKVVFRKPTDGTEKTVTKEEPLRPSLLPETNEEGQKEITTDKQRAEPDKNQTSAGTEHSKPSLAKKPDPVLAPAEKKSEEPSSKEPVLEIFDPGLEENKSEPVKTEPTNGNQPVNKLEKSSIVVETDRENNRYSFHYQFKDGKVFLYGPFEKNLYEILEFFANDQRTVFLYYNDRYYLLEEADSKIRELNLITDPSLLKKLNEYRSSN
jgi:hypothetical protein